MSIKHWIMLFMLGSAFGSSFAFNAVLLEHLGPLTVSAGRVLIGAAGCWIWLKGSGRSAGIARRDFARIAMLGIFQYAAPFAILPMAQQHVTSSAVGIANAMTPLAVVVVSQLWPGGEQTSARKLLGVACGIVGIVLLTSGVSQTEGSDARFVAFAILAPVCYAVALNVVRSIECKDPLVITTWALSFGAIAIMPAALITEDLPRTVTFEMVGAFAALGFCLTTVCFVAYFHLLPFVGATNLSLVTFIAPLSALCIGGFMLGEHIGVHHLAGAALILTGLAVLDGRVMRLLRNALSRAATVPRKTHTSHRERELDAAIET
ncbi:MAG: DMT family transporter [Pseudomonadota bacterium]